MPVHRLSCRLFQGQPQGNRGQDRILQAKRLCAVWIKRSPFTKCERGFLCASRVGRLHAPRYGGAFVARINSKPTVWRQATAAQPLGGWGEARRVPPAAEHVIRGNAKLRFPRLGSAALRTAGASPRRQSNSKKQSAFTLLFQKLISLYTSNTSL